jgi:sugar (pentulose or hexulose) kinase
VGGGGGGPRARVPHALHISDPDSFEHDAAAAWCEGPRRAVGDLGPAVNLAAGLGIAACVPSLAALGDHLEPLSPGLLYGDRRGRAAVAVWPPTSPLDFREGAAFLHWAARHWPGARAYWPAQALAAVALGGRPIIDSFTAMSYFPVFDGRRWDQAELSRIGITEEQLPIVVTEIGASAFRIAAGLAHQRAGRPAGEPAGGNGEPSDGKGDPAGGKHSDGKGPPAGGARREHGIAQPGCLGSRSGSHPGEQSGSHPGEQSGSHPGEQSGSHPGEQSGSHPGEQSGSHPGDGRGASTVLAPGGVDVMTEQITAGVSRPGEAHIMCGTTLLTWAVMPDNGDVPGLWRFPHLRPGLCLLGGPSNAGGLFLGWARGLLAGPRSSRRGPGGSGLHPDRVPLWTPYVRGERIPLHDTSLRASLHGLDLTHDASALLRAAYEAAGFVARRILDMAGCAPDRIVATGGGIRDSAWMQALADCIGVPVIRAAVPEGAALGMAWMARMAAGLESSLDDAARWSRPGRTVYPDGPWARACARRYEQFLILTAEVRAC